MARCYNANSKPLLKWDSVRILLTDTLNCIKCHPLLNRVSRKGPGLTECWATFGRAVQGYESVPTSPEEYATWRGGVELDSIRIAEGCGC